MLALGISLAAGFHFIGPAKSSAQTSGHQSSAGILIGQVTGVRENILQINNKDYEMKPDVIIKDEENTLMERSEIVPGAEVKCRHTHGRIDQIILILPR
jgi:hypothetical protein